MDTSTKHTLVLDVAATEGGALTVLWAQYRRFVADTANRYTLCVSTPVLEDTDNVAVLRFPWVKRSWLHRLWFEHVTVRRVARRVGADAVFSLQNVLPPLPKGMERTVYIHQSLPFCGYRFSLWRQPRLWVYQHLIGRRIMRSARRADMVVVQTAWMERAVMERAGIAADKLSRDAMEMDIATGETYRATGERRFFYPAAPYVYKNHTLILQAMALLWERGVREYSVTLTLPAAWADTAPPHLRPLLRCVGALPHGEVLALYAGSALLFPSYVETFGLPLLEARTVGSPVAASDCPFSREILEGYAAARFFDPFDPAGLANIMQTFLENGL